MERGVYSVIQTPLDEHENISIALRLAPTTAHSRIDVARTLINSLPGTCLGLDAFEDVDLVVP